MAGSTQSLLGKLDEFIYVDPKNMSSPDGAYPHANLAPGREHAVPN